MKKQVKPKKISWPFKTVSPELDKQREITDSMMEALGFRPPFEGEVQGFASSGKALRANQGKRRLSLLPMDVLEPIVEVLEFGAQKYAAWNFAEGDGLSWTEVSESLQRHLNAWNQGEDLDPESGKPHLGHIGCNLFFLLYYMKYAERYNVRDDRFKR